MMRTCLNMACLLPVARLVMSIQDSRQVMIIQV